MRAIAQAEVEQIKLAFEELGIPETELLFIAVNRMARTELYA